LGAAASSAHQLPAPPLSSGQQQLSHTVSAGGTTVGLTAATTEAIAATTGATAGEHGGPANRRATWDAFEPFRRAVFL
jgi:hypothetical protein